MALVYNLYMIINEEDILQKVIEQIKANVRSAIVAQGGTEEDVQTTFADNEEKILCDAKVLSDFFKEAFAQQELPL